MMRDYEAPAMTATATVVTGTRISGPSGNEELMALFTAGNVGFAL
jgi:hypothetical protein